jgi:RNA polymerase sigma-70 factor (ECF subfamily)
MKRWMPRTAVDAALRGGTRGDNAAWWSRWFPKTAVVDESEFQDQSEPYPGHWREFPQSWPVHAEDISEAQARLDAELAELPETWREVVLDRDGRQRDPERVRADHDLTPEQERAILNRARAYLRARLVVLFGGRTQR